MSHPQLLFLCSGPWIVVKGVCVPSHSNAILVWLVFCALFWDNELEKLINSAYLSVFCFPI